MYRKRNRCSHLHAETQITHHCLRKSVHLKSISECDFEYSNFLTPNSFLPQGFVNQQEALFCIYFCFIVTLY